MIFSLGQPNDICNMNCFQNVCFFLEKNIMKLKQKSNRASSALEILDNGQHPGNSTTNFPILTSSNDTDTTISTLNDNNLLIPSNNNTLTSSSSQHNNNSTTTTTNNNISTLTSTSNHYPGGRKSTSDVWKYAKKLNDGTTAKCNICDFTCVMSAHSTSSIRYHLIRKHQKQDLVIDSSSSNKPKISEEFKRELHALCYNAIVVDHRTFNDLRKNGIMAIFNKLCPGKTIFSNIIYLSVLLMHGL